MKTTNLTPHTIRIHNQDDSVITLEPSGIVPRVATKNKMVATGDTNQPDLFVQEVGEVENLPDPDGETLFIVSTMVRTACPDRHDLASPGELVRDENGQPIGCRGLVVNQ